MKQTLPARQRAFRLLLCLSLLFGTAAAQTPHITVRSGLSTGTAKQLVYGNGVYIAYFLYPTAFYTSTDGVSWSAAVAPTTSSQATLAFGDGRFVCVADSGMVFTSTNGVHWTSRHSGTTATLMDVQFLRGAFYTVGSNATFLRSPNGIHWDSLSTGKGSPFDSYTGIVYGNGRFVISAYGPAGYNPVLYRSDSGTIGSWTADTITSLSKVRFLKGHFYLFSLDRISVSSDAVNWTALPFSPSPGLPIDGFNDNTHVYLLSSIYDAGAAYGIIYPSADGLSFNIPAIYTTVQCTGGLYADHHDFIVGQLGLARSKDGVNYHTLVYSFVSLASHGSNYVAVGHVNNEGFIYSSKDFISWKEQSPDSTTPLFGVVYDGARYVAAGTGTAGSLFPPNGKAYASPHGNTWTSIGECPPITSLAYGAGRYVGVGLQGNESILYISTNGVNWTAAIPPESLVMKNIVLVKFLNGHFFAMGQYYGTQGPYLQPYLLTSADGVSWQNISPHFPFLIESVADIIYDGARYYIMGMEQDSIYNVLGFFSVSTAHINNPDSFGHKGRITDPPPGTLLGTGGEPMVFSYSHGHFLGGVVDRYHDGYAYLLYSGDGIHWDYTPLGVITNIKGIVTDGNEFRMAGLGSVWVTARFPRSGTRLSDPDTTLINGSAPQLTPGKESLLRLYPNPAAGSATLELPESGKSVVLLYDAAGNQVYRKEFNGYTVILPLQGLSAGIYHLWVQQGGKQYTREIFHR